MPRRYRRKEKTPRACQYSGCGKVFYSARADAAYCSGKCRAAESKEREREQIMQEGRRAYWRTRKRAQRAARKTATV